MEHIAERNHFLDKIYIIISNLIREHKATLSSLVTDCKHFKERIMKKRKSTKRHIESEELRKGFEILEETKSNLLHEVYSINQP